MPLVVPGHGQADALKYLVNKAKPEDLVLRLYTNDVYPTLGAIAATFEEATFPGYAPVHLHGDGWTVEDIATRAAEVFTRRTAGPVEKVYGYFLTRERSGRIAWAERFEQAPLPMTNAGDVIVVTPRIGSRT